jgi:dolichol-phosphate mannosyltransferase
MPKLSIIIPCYYNEHNIPVTSAALLENEVNFPPEVSFEYVMVDDGSKDGTFKALEAFKNKAPNKVKVVKLASNVGSYNAIMAGMSVATGDVNVMITADLQDPVELMPKMYEHWCRGYKLVIANREEREESFSKRLFANTFQWLMKNLALSNLPDGGFDYVLFDKSIREAIVQMDEKNTNSLYLMVWMGHEYVNIPYKRRERKIGKSRWTLKKKIKLFIDSFVSFSFFPIRAISVTGLILGVVALIYAMVVLISRFSGLIKVEGWTAMMVVFLFVSSFQMIALGILGEYVWRTLDASRNRPNYIIDKVL